jgi:hypothetical protein
MKQDKGEGIRVKGEGNPSTGSGRTELRVVYHAGPDAIGFCGRQWRRGAAQPVTAEEWAAMRARGDFNEFDFIEEK